MKLVAAAASLALLGVRRAQSAGLPPLPPWKLPQEGQPLVFPADSAPQRPGGLPPWWDGLQQAQISPGMQSPGDMRLQTPSFPLHQPSGLVQQRARSLDTPAPGLKGQQAASSTVALNTAPGMWRASNTARALQELLKNLDRAFSRQQMGGSVWGSEVVVPVENVSNALSELSRLLQEVIRLCEAEAEQNRMQGDFGASGTLGVHNPGPGVNFPVKDSIIQAAEYAKRVSEQMRLLRDLLHAVWAQSSNKAAVMKEVHRFNLAMADAKDVYQQGAQVSSAVAGAVLPYLSTCSFFSKASSHEAHRLWFLVGARISSAQRYLYQAMDMVRKVASRLPEFVSGKMQPQSLQDFARSKPFYKAAGYLDSAIARSASAVSYFNELAAAYNAHTQSSTFLPAEGRVKEDDVFPKEVSERAASRPAANMSIEPRESVHPTVRPEDIGVTTPEQRDLRRVPGTEEAVEPFQPIEPLGVPEEGFLADDVVDEIEPN